MRGRFLSTIVLGLGAALASATLATAAAPIPTNFNVTAMPGNEAEDAIAVNPTNPSNVVAMSTLPDVPAGLAVGVTFNAGSTWTRSVIGATAADPLGDICCDQQLAWDRFGNLWMTYLVNSSGDVLVALSTDGGTSFTKVADIQQKFGDQPSIAVGPNSVWVSYTHSPGTQIQAFGAPVTGLGQFGTFSTPENVPSPGNGDYGDTAVGPGGQVMVTYQNSTNGQGGADIYVAVDPDGLGSAGFGKPAKVAHSLVGGFDYIAAQPDRSVDAEANLAWDRSGGAHNGRVYLIWTQETPNESSGDTNGVPNDDFQIWATDSTNGGATFAPNFQVSQGTSNAVDANSFFDTGDYTHAAFVAGSFWPAWSDNSNSTGDNPNGTLHQFDLYTAKVSIP